MAEGARLEIVYVSKGASRVRIPLSPPVISERNAWQASFLTVIQNLKFEI